MFAFVGRSHGLKSDAKWAITLKVVNARIGRSWSVVIHSWSPILLQKEQVFGAKCDGRGRIFPLHLLTLRLNNLVMLTFDDLSLNLVWINANWIAFQSISSFQRVYQWTPNLTLTTWMRVQNTERRKSRVLTFIYLLKITFHWQDRLLACLSHARWSNFHRPILRVEVVWAMVPVDFLCLFWEQVHQEVQVRAFRNSLKEENRYLITLTGK